MAEDHDDLTAIEAANLCGINEGTMRRWLRAARIEGRLLDNPTRPGNGWRVSRRSVEAFLERRQLEQERLALLAHQARAAEDGVGSTPKDLVEAVAFHARLLRQWRRGAESRKQYRLRLGQYLKFLEAAGVAPGLEALTPDLVGRCLEWLRLHPRATRRQDGAAADAAFVRYMKAFARALTEAGVYADDPLRRVRGLREPTAQRTAYTDAELRALLDAADNGTDPVRDRALVLLLMDLGCRIGELCNADVADVDQERGTITFRRTKNGRPRQVQFRNPELADGGPCAAAVRAWLGSRSPSEPLFVVDSGRRMTTKRAEKIIGRLGARAGVPNAIPHRFRHTAATAFLSERPGAEIQLRARLGHVDPKILQTYVHQTQAMARDGATVASISSRLLAPGPVVHDGSSRLQTLQSVLALLDRDPGLGQVLRQALALTAAS